MEHQTEPETTVDHSKKAFSTREVLLVAAVAFLLLLLIGTWLWLIVDAKTETKVEVLKAFTALATPAVVLVGLKYTKEALEVNRGTLLQTAKSVENASKQLMIESRSKTEEMFYTASEALSSKNEHARIAALYTLNSLTSENSEMIDRIIDVISAFLRTRSAAFNKDLSSMDHEPGEYEVSDDVQVAIYHLGKILLEGQTARRERLVNLDGVNLSGVHLRNLSLEYCTMRGAIFIDTTFEQCNLTGAQFVDVTFKNVYLSRSILKVARFERCDIIDCLFHNCDLSHVLEAGTNNYIDVHWTWYLYPLHDKQRSSHAVNTAQQETYRVMKLFSSLAWEKMLASTDKEGNIMRGFYCESEGLMQTT